MTEPVVNASPLIHFGKAKQLSLLRDLFGKVIVPETVADELLAGSEKKRVEDDFRNSPWLRVVPAVKAPDALITWDLGAGETAVLALAMKAPGTEAILDDWAGRRCAKSLGIPVCGTLSVVLRCARKGIVSDPVSLMNKLRDTGMWLSNSVFDEAVGLAGEIINLKK